MVICSYLPKKGDAVHVRWKITPKRLTINKRMQYGSVDMWILEYLQNHRGIEIAAYVTGTE